MFTIDEIAKKLDGRVIGDSNKIISNISTPEDIQDGSIVFIKDKKHFNLILNSNHRACIVVPFEPEDSSFDYIVIEKENKDKTFINLLEIFSETDKKEPGVAEVVSISKKSKIDKSTTIGLFTAIEDDVEIGENTIIDESCFIGKGTKIGNGCHIYPGVKVYSNTMIEDNVILHSGVVVGSDGFGYRSIDGKNVKIPQIGGAYIEKGVEIGANSTIDRATIGYTRIGENTKIDNLVHIGHNVKIGYNTIICALCGISGSVKIGNNVIIAGAVGLKDHIEIEDDVYIGAKAGVMERHVKRGAKLLGIPAIDFRAEMEFIAIKPKLKGMYKDIKKIKKNLGI